jgi:predicted DNA binding protein
MVVITDITVPADQFALGQLFDEYPDIAIELERLVPLDGGTIPLFWVEGENPADVEATIREDPLSEDVKVLTEMEERYLFEVLWSAEIDALISPLRQSRAEVLRAEGGTETWEFRLQFRDRADLAEFRDACQANDVQIDLKALYNPTLPAEDDEDELTPEQYDILATAYSNGYWNVPRGVELGEIADLIGISPNAASQRMRRGLKTVVGGVLEPEDRQS